MIQDFCERIKTTRRYLHPPFSERMFTLWAEGKIIFGEHDVELESSRIMEHRVYDQQVSCGIWPLYGEDLNRFDYENVKNTVSEDGTPIHGVILNGGDMELTLECFCNTERKSTLFGAVTVRNIGSSHLQDKLTLLLRTALEADIVYGMSDAYIHHDPDPEQWKKITPCWYKNGEIYTDNTRQLQISIETEWNRSVGGAVVPVDLAPGASVSFTFKLDMGEVSEYDYQLEKEKTVAFWQKELSRISRLPAAVARDPEMLKTVRHMTAQLLQMVCYTRLGWVIPRQGGMQRVIWPTEALSMIEGLCRIGDFEDYIEPIFHTYFDYMQMPSGEIGPLGIYWGSMTAAVLYSFAQYCSFTRNKAFFSKYSQKAYAAFRFIKELRRSVVDTDELAGGLFPILRGIDWSQQFQCWTSTDVFNVLALDALADVYKAYSAPVAVEIRHEHAEYLADMKRHFKKYYDAQAGLSTLRIPLMPKGDDTALVADFYPLLYQGRFVYCGVIDNEADTVRVYNQMVETGVTIEGLGLYGHIPYRNGNNNVWYLSFPDYYWFEIWMQYGKLEKAKEILDAQFRYAMTAEYYFAERMDTSDPYYVPWSPNASATGRALIMLTKYYG